VHFLDVRCLADTGTAKSGNALATAQARWPFLAMWLLAVAVASGMPVLVLQCPTQVDPSKFLHCQGPLATTTALRTTLQALMHIAGYRKSVV
jgi:hypothetical protein